MRCVILCILLTLGTFAFERRSLSASRWRPHPQLQPRLLGTSTRLASTKEDQMAQMVKMIIDAVDEGKEADLEKAGLKVTKRSMLEIMQSNLSNEQIVEKVLGSMTGAEEQEILGLLAKAARSEEVDVGAGTGLDAGLLAELRAEAEMVTKGVRDGGLLAQLLSEGKDTPGVVQQQQSGVVGFERSLRESQSGGEALPTFGISGYLEEETDPSEWEDEEEAAAAAVAATATVEVMSGSGSSSSSSSSSSGGGDMVESIVFDRKAIEEEAGLSEESKALAQATFTQLLKATMDSSEANAPDTEEETMKQTLEAVASGDYSALDIKSLLGETLGTLAEELGIDVKSELGGSKTQGDMQNIIASSMSELATNMAELDEQSQQLFEKLGNLEEELRMETAAFDMQKSSELEDLLGRQAQLQGDIASSRQKVQATSDQLEKLMSDLDEKADLLTALALFPIKTIDKKLAFVFGLALFFKVSFDAALLFNIRSSDFSDWFGVVVQGALGAAFFNHYGLLRAAFQPKTNLGFNTPPPLSESE